MAVGVGGRILIRHLGRCEMGKWDKLSRRGVQESGAFVLLFGEIFFFSLFFFICYPCESAKRTCEKKKKNRPLCGTGGSFSQDCWRHICLKFFAIWLSELFQVVIKS